ncbi:MAG TPA: hypothetical protein VHG09_04300 [Longimicrobiales bacterium]|nr:hypothetical protein [Longimicrobiales bacterium]
MKMGLRATAGLSAIVLLLGLSGCEDSEDAIGRFEWSELPTAPVDEYSSADVFATAVAFIGEFNTPTGCYRVTPAYEQSGASGTLRIRAGLTDRDDCGQEVTSYRYQGLLQGLGGVTELRVRHEIEGEETNEFVHDLTTG